MVLVRLFGISGNVLHKSCCNDDSGSEVSGKEIHIDVDPKPFYSGSDDRKEGSSRTGDENNKES